MAAPIDPFNESKLSSPNKTKVLTNTLFVSGIPYAYTNEELYNTFKSVGEIKQCFVVEDKNSANKLNKGVGYVRLSSFKEAEKAIQDIKKINGRKVTIKFADRSFKAKKGKRSEHASTRVLEGSTSDSISTPKTTGCSVDSSQKVNKPTKKNQNKARIIIRNLSFSCNAYTLQSHFSNFGKIKDVSILKNPSDGTSRGVGFIQFAKLKSAARAIQLRNGTKILGRVIAVDWVVDKNQLGICPESVESEDEEDKEKEEEERSGSSSEQGDGSGASEEDENSEGSEEEAEMDVPKKARIDRSRNVRLTRDSDVKEGRTLFIRNLLFDVKEEELTDLMSEFGELKYCLLVRDKTTDMCKGSAFVQFIHKDQAENCLSQCQTNDGALYLNGRKLLVTMAMNKQHVTDLKKVKEKEDKRNLHLLREGMVREGTQEATGLSQAELVLRRKIEGQMKSKLKNPVVFFSPTRLVVNNIPYSVNNKQLHKVMVIAAGTKGVKVTECRIMRYLDKVGSSGLAHSKGYAFVAFTEHQHALEALRNTNNTDVFKVKKRLIVHFSLENRSILEMKRKRQLRSMVTQQTEEADVHTNKPRLHNNQPIVTTVKSDKPKQKNLFPSHSGPKIRHKQRSIIKKKKSKPVSRKDLSSKHDHEAKQKQRRSNKEIFDATDNLFQRHKNRIENQFLF